MDFKLDAGCLNRWLSIALMFAFLMIVIQCRQADQTIGGTKHADDVLLDQDPFSKDDFHNHEEVLQELSGEWMSDNGSMSVSQGIVKFGLLRDVNASFESLSSATVKLTETLSFSVEDSEFDIYWVWQDPDRLSVLSGGSSDKSLSSMHFRRVSNGNGSE